MKNKLSALICFCLIAFLHTSLVAQETPLNSFIKKVDESTDKNAQEKVYLHLDKPFYAIGDDIWFKAYTVNAKTGKPSLKSRIIYVELINEKDSVAKQLKLPLTAGITWGDFKLTDSLAEGNYRIRAYTQWMRNAESDYFFDKTIKIGNSWTNKVFIKSDDVITPENDSQKITTTLQFADKQNLPYTNAEVYYEVKINNKIATKGKGITNNEGKIEVSYLDKHTEALKKGSIYTTITLPNKQKIVKEIPLKATSKEIDVQFFPEGGVMVENLPNRIGFKAINANGLGEAVTGVITTTDGLEISNIESNKLGMGSFFLNPIANQIYSVKIKFANGGEKTFKLPQAQKSGTILTVNNTDSTKISAKIYLSEDLLNKNDLILIAQHNGNVYFSTPINTTRQVIALSLPKDSLPSGIVQFSLLSPDFSPLNERIVFINNSIDKISINPENLAQNSTKRGKVDLQINAKNNNEPIQGSFSVAVTNSAAVKPDPENETNIYTKLLLTSDLKGYVEKPNYYFLNNDSKTKNDLDNLLLTQGWRKLNWKQIADAKEVTPTFPVEERLKISGLVKKGGNPVVKGKITLISLSNGFFMIDTLTDNNGRFNFDKIEFRDSIKFIVQARTDKDKKFVDIIMDNVPGITSNQNPNTGDIEVNVNQSLSGYLTESGKYFDDLTKRGLLNKTILLDQVNIVEKRKATNSNSSNLNGSGRADAVFNAKDLENAFSLSSYLAGRVAGIQIRDGQAFSRNNPSPMALIIDGMNFGGDDYKLDDINVPDVETVEILKSISNTAIYGSQGGAGVIIITTKRGDGSIRATKTYTPGLINIAPKGYALVREFYSPKYDAKPDNRPDLRTTVLWNPTVMTDKNGKASIQYFNTDVAGTYRIVIEGIDINGNIGRKVMTYEVK